MSFKLLIAVEKKLARKVLLVSGNYAPRRPICEKSGNQTISSPKWSIRSLVTPKKLEEKIFMGGCSRTRWFFLNTMKKKLRFLWFLMIIWVILGGFRSWTFFDWSVCFWVTGQIIWKKVIFLWFWPYLYLLNYWFLWKFTGTLFCLKSVFIRKKNKEKC